MHIPGLKLLAIAILVLFGSVSTWSQTLVYSPWQASFSPINSFDLNQDLLHNSLANTTSRWESTVSPGILISLPQPDGNFSTFQVWRSEQMEPELADRYPSIQTYFGQALDNHRQNVYLLLTAQEVKVFFFEQGGMTSRLDIINVTIPTYQFTQRPDWGIPPDVARVCQATMDEESNRFADQQIHQGRRGEVRLYRYRLALACTGEYTNYHGGTKEATMVAMNELLLQVNAIFERETSIHFDLIAHNDTLIFLDPLTDPYDNTSMPQMLESNKDICNERIGYSNFDVGHVLSTKFGGQAHIGSVCNSSRKAKAFSGLEHPEGYYMGVIFTHELAHQIGAQHTQSGDCNRNLSTAYEVGSGSTIMSYAGLCEPNIQNLPDDYFHANSLELLKTKTAQGIIFGCNPGTPTDNRPPQADAGADLYIPIGTPFQLQGLGGDANGDSLSYLWEQMDVLSITDPKAGPVFRSLPPTSSPVRTIGTKENGWEDLPQSARSATFRLTVKDIHMGLGSMAYDEMTVHFIDSVGPFKVLTPNLPSVRWEVGSTQTITWDEAKTSQAPVLCEIVDIYLSLDGGENFNILLAQEVPNNGSLSIEVPNFPGTQSKIKVLCNAGFFFDMSDDSFEIFDDTPEVPIDTITNDTIVNPGQDTIVNPGQDTIVNPGQDTIVNPGQDTIVNPGQDTIVNPGQDTIVNPGQDTIVNPGQDTIVNPGQDTIVNPGQDTIVNPGQDTIVNPGQDTIVNPEQDTIVNPGQDTIVNPGQDTIVNPGQDTIVNPGQDTIVNPGQDTILNPGQDTIVNPGQDTIVNPGQDTIVNPGQDTIVNPGQDTIVNPGQDTIVNPGQDTIVNPGQDTIVNPGQDTIVNPGQDTIVNPGQDTILNPGQDTIVNPGQDTILNPGQDTIVNPGQDTILNPGQDTILNPGQDTIVNPGQDTIVNPGQDTIVNPGQDTIVNPGQDTIPDNGELPSVDLPSNTPCVNCDPTITIAPNPTSGPIRIRMIFNKSEPLDWSYSVLNGQGQVLQKRSIRSGVGWQEMELDMSTYPSGLYWIRIVMDGRHWVKPMVVKR